MIWIGYAKSDVGVFCVVQTKTKHHNKTSQIYIYIVFELTVQTKPLGHESEECFRVETYTST